MLFPIFREIIVRIRLRCIDKREFTWARYCLTPALGHATLTLELKIEEIGVQRHSANLRRPANNILLLRLNGCDVHRRNELSADIASESSAGGADGIQQHIGFAENFAPVTKLITLSQIFGCPSLHLRPLSTESIRPGLPSKLLSLGSAHMSQKLSLFGRLSPSSATTEEAMMRAANRFQLLPSEF
jgi:hypothetical protein